MSAAYTLYKFKYVFLLVVIIAIFLAVFSQVPSEKDIAIAAGKAVATSDKTGQIQNAVNVAEQIPDPKGDVENGVGQWFFNLISKNPTQFFVVCIVIAIILFILGVRLATLRGYLRGFG